MTKVIANNSGNVRIYGAGGCGINIASVIGNRVATATSAATSCVYVDTSKSNLNKVKDENAAVFLLEGVDGSGKVRKENYNEISDKVGELLLAHGPLDLNLVIFSCSGGSGSVYGPLIVRELLLRGAAVIALVVGSKESAITANNTLNTLKSLENIVRKTEASLVMHYNQNPTDSPRTVVDAAVLAAVQSLLVLGSGVNDGLDSKDLINFLRFERATRVQPRLALLDILTSNHVEELESQGVKHVISLASIYNSEEGVPLQIPYDYLAEGIRAPADGLPEVLHFVTHSDELKAIVKDLTETVQYFDTIHQSRGQVLSITGDKDQVEDDGLVL